MGAIILLYSHNCGSWHRDYRRKCDISELYDFLKSRAGCWCVVCDIYHLIPINDISRKAGDLKYAELFPKLVIPQEKKEGVL
jgi:hypothetical protein